MLPIVLLTAITMSDIHTGFDTIPDFAAFPTLTSVRSGSWSDAGTWDGNRIPDDDDIVLIRQSDTVSLLGTSVAVPTCAALGVAGALRHERSTLRVGTVLIYEGGLYRQADRTTLVIRDIPVTDPDQFGTGLIVLGEWEAHGTGEPELHVLSNFVASGSMNALIESDASDVNTYAVFADTRTPWQYEELGWTAGHHETEYRECSVSGKAISVTSPLRYSHSAGCPVVLWKDGIDVRSENPNGTRGHVIVAGHGRVTLFGVVFSDLGRTRAAPLDPVTNHIGRYSLHLHHLHESGSFICDCIVRNNLRWGIAVHDSPGVTLTRNLIFNSQGAGIVLEQGSESDCTVTDNIVCLVHGTPVEGTQQRGEEASQRAGSGYWINTADNNQPHIQNEFAGNVAINCKGPGFNLFLPNYEDTSVSGKASGIFTSHTPPLRLCTVYYSSVGFESWRVTHPDAVRLYDCETYNCMLGINVPFDASAWYLENCEFFGVRNYPFAVRESDNPDTRYASCAIKINGGYLHSLTVKKCRMGGTDYGIYTVDRWPVNGVEITDSRIDHVHTGIYAPWIIVRDDVLITPDTGWFIDNLEMFIAERPLTFPEIFTDLPKVGEEPITITADYVAVP